MDVATLAELWRFPVKSMGGQRVDEVAVNPRGVHADRLWAVRDLENDITASARRIPALLGCLARYASAPGPDAGPGNAPEVVITLPDGSEVSSSDPDVHARLSEAVGRDVRLIALPPVGDTSAHRLSVQQGRSTFSVAEVRRDFGLTGDEALPDTSMFSAKQLMTLARFSTPPGTFVDLGPVHLLSTASLASLSPGEEHCDSYDVRRFRPNVLLEIGDPDGEFPEAGWVGSRLHIGTSTMRVTTPTIRCVVPTRPQPGLEPNRALTRRLAERTDRFLGVYADVTEPGMLRVGDGVCIEEAGPPTVVSRAAATVGKTAMRGMQRLLEATVLRAGE
ncbi:MOSC domain-containing protein [Mycobacterium sp. URHB0021]